MADYSEFKRVVPIGAPIYLLIQEGRRSLDGTICGVPVNPTGYCFRKIEGGDPLSHCRRYEIIEDHITRISIEDNLIDTYGGFEVIIDNSWIMKGETPENFYIRKDFKLGIDALLYRPLDKSNISPTIEERNRAALNMYKEIAALKGKEKYNIGDKLYIVERTEGSLGVTEDAIKLVSRKDNIIVTDKGKKVQIKPKHYGYKLTLGEYVFFTKDEAENFKKDREEMEKKWAEKNSEQP